MDSQNNIALIVPDNGCWVDGGVVEEPHYIIVGFLCGLLLGCGKVAQGDHYSGIHLHDIVNKIAQDFAHHGDAFWW